jgi:hypothetical protein
MNSRRAIEQIEIAPGKRLSMKRRLCGEYILAGEYQSLDYPNTRHRRFQVSEQPDGLAGFLDITYCQRMQDPFKGHFGIFHFAKFWDPIKYCNVPYVY